jgi:hypothetical protein
MSAVHRHLLKAIRLAHLYLTLFGVVVILLFAVTGFMLNHENWFMPSEPRTRTVEVVLSTQLLDPLDKLEISEALRRECVISGTVNSYRADDDSIEIEYVRPSERVVAEVRRPSGQATVTFESWGIAGLMTDLHKGKSAGRAWGVLIDATCVLLVLISGTGLYLWHSLRSRGKWGLMIVVLGAGIAAVVYYRLVP